MHMSYWSFLAYYPGVVQLMFFLGLTFSSRMFILDRWAFVVAEAVKVVSSLTMSALICVSFVYFQTLE